MTTPASAVTNMPRVLMLRVSFCRENSDWTKPTSRSSPSSARRRSAPHALTVSTAETSSTRWAESRAQCSMASSERRRVADRLAHLGGVVDAGEDLAHLPHLEEAEGQAEQVAVVAGDQSQVHLAAD